MAAVAWIGCGDLAHDNPYDPKNPNAEAGQIAVAENFIVRYTNQNMTPPPVWYSQSALYALKEEYGSRLVVLEYHMAPWSAVYVDSLASGDDTLRYNNEYKPASVNRGFPHVFFNGKNLHIQGASSQAVAQSRYKTILDSLTIKKIKLYCEAERSVSGGSLSVESRIVRYGDTDISGLKVEYMVVQPLGDSLRYTVRRHLQPETVTTIGAGDILDMPTKTYDIPAGVNPDLLTVVILIKSSSSGNILQAAIAE